MPLTEYNFGIENDFDRKLYGRCRFKKAISLLYFERSGLTQTLIHALKYRGIEPIGQFLGKWMGSSLAQDPDLPKIDWVIPVPLHPAKKRIRGYNQCTLFGKTVASILRANWEENYLLRKDAGGSQTKKNRRFRASNAQSAFSGQNLDLLEDKTVLLVDDVVTTGATLEACCEALSKTTGNPPRIYIATMAVVL